MEHPDDTVYYHSEWKCHNCNTYLMYEDVHDEKTWQTALLDWKRNLIHWKGETYLATCFWCRMGMAWADIPFTPAVQSALRRHVKDLEREARRQAVSDILGPKNRTDAEIQTDISMADECHMGGSAAVKQDWTMSCYQCERKCDGDTPPSC